eukprot:16428762-Heterocapsa_arctica.AAC.1
MGGAVLRPSADSVASGSLEGDCTYPLSAGRRCRFLSRGVLRAGAGRRAGFAGASRGRVGAVRARADVGLGAVVIG